MNYDPYLKNTILTECSYNRPGFTTKLSIFQVKGFEVPLRPLNDRSLLAPPNSHNWTFFNPLQNRTEPNQSSILGNDKSTTHFLIVIVTSSTIKSFHTHQTQKQHHTSYTCLSYYLVWVGILHSQSHLTTHDQLINASYISFKNNHYDYTRFEVAYA